MKAIKIENKMPTLIDSPAPIGDGVLVNVVASSICGTDLHLIDLGYAEGLILGHEFAGYTPDGTAVAIEPVLGCGGCEYCDEGYRGQCSHGLNLFGNNRHGGMAQSIMVPAENLVPLPTGLDIRTASLIEPLSVAAHGLNQAGVKDTDRVLVIGGGSIGMAVAAVLKGRGMRFDMSVRHAPQRLAAEKLGATINAADGYDVVIDAVGTEASVAEAAQRVKARGRIGMVGTFWQPTPIPTEVCVREITLIGALLYKCSAPNRTFVEVGKLLASHPDIAEVMISHRFPLEGAVEAFATARDRASGAIKVCFDV